LQSLNNGKGSCFRRYVYVFNLLLIIIVARNEQFGVVINGLIRLQRVYGSRRRGHSNCDCPTLWCPTRLALLHAYVKGSLNHAHPSDVKWFPAECSRSWHYRSMEVLRNCLLLEHVRLTFERRQHTGRNIVKGMHRLAEAREATAGDPERGTAYTMPVSDNTTAWNIC